jgi:hypothetical protein
MEDKVLKQQKAVLDFLQEYAAIQPAGWQNVSNQVVADKDSHHYQLVRVGWHNTEHIHYTLFHFDLVNGKVVVQENKTDLPIVDQLVEKGINREDIVIAALETPHV